MNYVVKFDFTESLTHNHEELMDKMSSYNAKLLMPDAWLVNRLNTTATDLMNYLRRFIGVTERILVVSLDNAEWASHNLITNPHE